MNGYQKQCYFVFLLFKFEPFWWLKQEGGDITVSTGDAAVSASASHPTLDSEWQSKTEALSASPGHPESTAGLRSTLSFLWSGGLRAFISSFLPRSHGRQELASSLVRLSGFHPQQSEGQTTPRPLWRRPRFCVQMTCSWSRFSLWTLVYQLFATVGVSLPLD